MMDKVACPTSKNKIEWSTSNSYRPFCSERCKLIDLGAWADGSYAIPVEPVNPDDYESQVNRDSDEPEGDH
jgi:endogenous inhibitor of DNA gyrase (YacG/DUF329 family)